MSNATVGARPAAPDGDPLVAQITELACAAVRAWRKEAPFGSAILLAIPDSLIDQWATRWAPLERAVALTAARIVFAEMRDEMRDEIREVVCEACRAELDAADLATIACTAEHGGTRPTGKPAR